VADEAELVQLVVRTRPRLLVYVRRPPPTIWRPTPAQADVRRRFGEVIRESRRYTVEEVARMVGGEVVEVNGKKAIKMPDGRVLMKHMAYASYAMRGYRSPHRRIPVPAWLEELSKRYYLPIPGRAVAARPARPERAGL
jgi:hypothetical protein